MKKTIVFLLSIITLLLVMINTDAQVPKTQSLDTKNNLVAHKAPFTLRDSIPKLQDSTYFINNNDLVQVLQVMKRIMSSPQYLQSDGITQYEILFSNINQVFLYARIRWERQNTIVTNPEQEKKDKSNNK